MGMFTVDLKDIKNQQRFFRQAPKQYGHAARAFQNRAAFRNRELAIMTVSRMTNRAEKFNRSRLRVKKATGTNISRMAAITGSITSDRHTGWIEQETGKRQKRTRSQTIEARGGSWERKVRPSVRLKPGAAMLNPEKDGTGSSKEQRLATLLSGIKSGKFSKKVFMTRKRYRGAMQHMSRGVFQYKRKKIIRMQNFERPKQPKKRTWMKDSRALLGKRFNVSREWEKSVIPQLKFIK